ILVADTARGTPESGGGFDVALTVLRARHAVVGSEGLTESAVANPHIADDRTRQHLGLVALVCGDDFVDHLVAFVLAPLVLLVAHPQHRLRRILTHLVSRGSGAIGQLGQHEHAALEPTLASRSAEVAICGRRRTEVWTDTAVVE